MTQCFAKFGIAKFGSVSSRLPVCCANLVSIEWRTCGKSERRASKWRKRGNSSVHLSHILSPQPMFHISVPVSLLCSSAFICVWCTLQVERFIANPPPEPTVDDLAATFAYPLDRFQVKAIAAYLKGAHSSLKSHSFKCAKTWRYEWVHRVTHVCRSCGTCVPVLLSGGTHRSVCTSLGLRFITK